MTPDDRFFMHPSAFLPPVSCEPASLATDMGAVVHLETRRGGVVVRTLSRSSSHSAGRMPPSERRTPARPRCTGARFWGTLLVPLLLISACDESHEAIDKRVADARPAAGKAIIFSVGCGVCHIIPGIPGANGTVGPSLEGFAERNLIGGVVPNRPELLAQWVRDAPSLIEETGMPDLPITEEEAPNVAEYLYTLR